MLDHPTELIQAIGYAISALIGIITFLSVTLPNIIRKAGPLRAAFERLLESEAPIHAANGNGSGVASLALATLGQAHQNELSRLAKAFEDFVADNSHWREQVAESYDQAWRRLTETTTRHETALYDLSVRLRKLEMPPAPSSEYQESQP